MRDCLSDETMAAYVDGRLASDERRSVESHLVRCDRCLQEVALLKRVTDSRESFAGIQIPEHVWARAEALIAERLSRRAPLIDLVARVAKDWVSVVRTTGEILTPDLQPVPARGRSRPGKNIFVRKTAGEADVIIELESKGDRPILRILLTNADTREPLHGVRVDLAGPSGPETRFSERGLADFGPREPGRYRISIEDLGDVALGLETTTAT
jgi:hypothetical protein